LGKAKRITLFMLTTIVAAFLLLTLLILRPAAAQGVLADGDAAVTSFSGAMPPPMIAPGQDPTQHTVIDPNGASLRVIQLQTPGGAPQGQVAQAPKGLTISAAQIGQAFAVTLDNASPPNIYVAAASVYGLPIVGANGQRLAQGAPGAQFMPGLFGRAPGGPGSIWRIDGQSGDVRLFATVAFEGTPNGGPALGGLAFDNASRTLFVADRETGMIHAFDTNGGERGRYDHGFTGREAGGLPQVQFDPSLRLNIASPQFQPLVPSTWGYAPPSRRVFGLAVREGRLYYAVAEKLQVWSVSITPEGAFGTDARVEVTVAPGQGPSEISKIAFDDSGRMLLAERAAPSPAADFAALTSAGGRVLRYTRAPTGWTPEEFAVGFAAGNHAGNGGVAVGYGYANGQRDRNACSGFVWMSGEQLRGATEAALAGQLAQGGAANVNGLQGSAASAVLPANVPPQQSYFVDLDDRFDDANARGQAGDVAIRRDCAPGGAGAPAPGVAEIPPGGPLDFPPPEGDFWPGAGAMIVDLWPDWPPPPPPVCPIGTHPEPNGVQCCPGNMIPGVSGACQSPCANGSMNPFDMTACMNGFQPGSPPAGPNPGVCWNGSAPVKVNPLGPNTYANNKCPKPPLKRCPSGMQEVAGGPPAVGWQWSNVHCVPIGAAFCPVGQQPNMAGVCQNLCPGGQRAYPVNRCCVNGTHVNALGQCPGVVVPPQWYLDFLATGTGPCLLPDGNCSYYEYTITGRQRFGRGSLSVRITLPPDSAFPDVRVTRGSKYCPASAWTCTKSGNGFTCTAEDCGLASGEQVVLRTEGRVVPKLTQPPPAPIDKTACAVLDWQALPGPGRTVIEQLRDTGKATPLPQTLNDGVGTDQFGRTSSRQACHTITVIPRTPACPANYVQLPSGQCCVASQMAGEQCCPVGQKPDARRQTCVPVSPPTVVIPPVFVPPLVVRECPRGRYWDGRQCVRRCPAGMHAEGRHCVPNVACPAGTHMERGKCVPDIVQCPSGTHRVGNRCMPDVIACPVGTRRVGNRCMPEVIACPVGTRRVGNRCVPVVKRPTFQQTQPIRPNKPIPRQPILH
jgi:hypothetical protein